MKKFQLRLSIGFVVILCCVFVPRSALAQAPLRLESNTITLGVVSTINEKEIERQYRDFALYVARKLSISAGRIEGKVVVAPTLSDLARLLEQRKVDFYMESAYPTYVINNEYAAGQLLLRRWQRGKAEYRSLIFAKKNSGINSLEDLQGKVIAFEDPESTSGHFLPRFFLLNRGFKLVETARPAADSSPPEIGFIFAYSQAKIVEFVLAGQAAAGAFNDDDYAALNEKRKSDISILAETESLPRHLVSIRKDMAPVLARELEKILVSMTEDEEGAKVLQKTGDTTKFDTFPGGEEAMRQRLMAAFLSPGSK